MKLHLQTRVVDDVAVLYCNGRLTYRHEASTFSEMLAALITNHPQVVIEMSGLEAIDSAGLGELVVVHMWARANGCTMKVAGASPRIQQLFELTNLLPIFDTWPTLDAALQSLSSQGVRTEVARNVA